MAKSPQTRAHKSGREQKRGRPRQPAFESLESRRVFDTTISVAFQYPTLDQSGTGIYSAVRDAAVVATATTGGNVAPLAHLVPGSNPPAYSTAPLYTNNSGSITFDTNGVAASTTTIQFTISADSDPSRPAGEYKVVNPVANQANPPVYSFPTAPLNVPANGGTITFPTQQLTVAAYPNVAALAVFDGLTIGALYGDTLAAQTPNVKFPGLTAQYPANQPLRFGGETTDGVLTSATIYVPSSTSVPGALTGEEYAYQRIAHEFGHYMAAVGGFYMDIPVPDHSWQEDLADANVNGTPLGYAKGYRAAMNEGFADYFAVMASNLPANAGLNLYGVTGDTYAWVDFNGNFNVGGAFPSLTVDSSWAIDGVDPSSVGKGQRTEGGVARIMYALSTGDYQPDVGAAYALTASTLWQVLVANNPPSLSQLIFDAQQTQAPSQSQSIGINWLKQVNGLTPVPNPIPQQQGAVPNGDDGGVQTYSYLPGGTPPTFQFTIPQVTDPPAGVAADELNAFSIVFLDANYNEIDYSVVDSNGDYSDEDVDGFTGLAAVANSSGVFVGGSYIAPLDESASTVSWQPTTAEWQVIAAANPAYWEVVGRNGAEYFPIVDGQSTAPAGFVDTGDYTSAAQPITVLPAPQVSVTYPDGTGEDVPADATIGIPYTTSQSLTVNYTIYTQTLATEPDGYGGYTVTGSGTIAQAGSGSVTFAAGSDDDEDVTLPGVYLDPAQPLVTLIVVSLPGETVPDSAAVAGIGSSWVGDSEDQAWPIYVGTDENISVTATTPTTTYGGDPGVVQFTRSGDTSLPMLITPWGGTTGDSIVSSENGVSMPDAEESGQTALYFPPGVATTDVDVTATAASTYAGSDYGVEIGGGGEINGDGFDSATVTVNVPAVSISGGGTIDEAWGSTYLTISRTGPTTASLPVYFQASGTATMGQDYFTLPSDPSARPEAARAFSAAAAESSPGATWPGGYVAQRAAETRYGIAL